MRSLTQVLQWLAVPLLTSPIFVAGTLSAMQVDPPLVVQTSRPNHFSSKVALSPGGGLALAAATGTGIVEIWNTNARRRLKSLVVPEGYLVDVDFCFGGLGVHIETDQCFEVHMLTTGESFRFERVGVPGMLAPADLRTEPGQALGLALGHIKGPMALTVKTGPLAQILVVTPTERNGVGLFGFHDSSEIDPTDRFIAGLGISYVHLFELDALSSDSQNLPFQRINFEGRAVEGVAFSASGERIAVAHHALGETPGDTTLSVYEVSSGELLGERIHGRLRRGAAQFGFHSGGARVWVKSQPGGVTAPYVFTHWSYETGALREETFPDDHDVALASQAPLGLRAPKLSAAFQDAAATNNPASAPRLFHSDSPADLGPVQLNATTSITHLYSDPAEGRIYGLTSTATLVEVNLGQGTLDVVAGGVFGLQRLSGGGMIMQTAKARPFLQTLDPSEPRVFPSGWFDEALGLWQVGMAPDLSKVGASVGSEIRVFHPRTGELIHRLERPPVEGEVPANGVHLSFVGDQRLELIDDAEYRETWDLGTGTLVERTHQPGIASKRYQNQAMVTRIDYAEDVDRWIESGDFGIRTRRLSAKSFRLFDRVRVESFVLDSARRRIAYLAGSEAVVLDLEANEVILRVPGASSTPAFGPDDRLLFVDLEGGIQVHDMGSDEPLATAYFSEPEGYLFVTPDKIYKANRTGVSAIALQVGLDMAGFSTEDVFSHQPDVLLERLGSDNKEEILVQRDLVDRRLMRLGLDRSVLSRGAERPFLQLAGSTSVTTAASSVDLPIMYRDDEAIDRVFVTANGSPVDSQRGRVLDENGRGERVGKDLIKRQISVPLAMGRNFIDLAVASEAGVRSHEFRIVIDRQGKPPAPRTFLLALGVSDYQQSAFNLKEAANDARRMAAEFEEILPMEVLSLVLVDTEVTRDALGQGREFLEQAEPQDHVIVSIAGHGLRGQNGRYWFATHDVDFAAPEERAISFNDLEDLLDGLGSRSKLLAMDTCMAGEIDAGRNARGDLANGARGFGVPAAPSHGTMGRLKRRRMIEEVFVDLRRGSGATVIAAAGGEEYAFEDDERGGVFTDSLLEGLRSRSADLDKDGAITSQELAKYVADRVEEVTGGRQRPATKRENVEFSFPVMEAEKVPWSTLTWAHAAATCGRSGDGKIAWIQTAYPDEITLRRAEDGEELTRLASPDGAKVTLSWDGSHVLLATDERAEIVSVESGQRVELPFHEQLGYIQVPPVALPGRARFAVTGRIGKGLRVISLTEEDRLETKELDLRLEVMSWSQADERLRVLDNHQALHDVDLESMSMVRRCTLEMADDAPSFMLFSPQRGRTKRVDQRILSVTTNDRTAVLAWDTATGEQLLVARPRGKTPTIWSRSGEFIAGYLGDHSYGAWQTPEGAFHVELRDLESGDLIRRLELPDGTQLEINQEGGVLLAHPDAQTASRDPLRRHHEVMLYDLPTLRVAGWQLLDRGWTY